MREEADRSTTTHTRNSIWGFFVLALGLWWLLGATGLVPFAWSYAGPLALVAVGASMVLGRSSDCC